ncbi:MAG TPA: hypothetical protein VJ783_15395 [Pirellulales bacterium]|nr:hypothetical protein [Pirellulales bacterium]
MEPTSSEPRAEGVLSPRAGDARGGVEIALPDRVYRALASLVESYDYARDLGCDPWDFAVELTSLRRLGVTNWDCRWLEGKKYVQHAAELTMPGEPVRTFRQGGVLLFGKRTCFVLTEAGEHFARRICRESPGSRLGTVGPASLPSDGAALLDAPAPAGGVALAGANGDLLEQSLKPVWDRDRQQLRVGKKIVKEFKVPAANQEVILAAFQEEHWPPRVDDPLPPHPEQDPKRRLHDTINSLNRNQKQSLIKFLGDGSGQGVRWEFTSLVTGNGG